MRKSFDFEGPVFSFLSKFADLIWLNILFIVCCIPVFTVGAALTALYYVTLKMVRDEEGYITKSFFKSFKQNFKQATAIWLLIVLVAGILFMDCRIVTDVTFVDIVPSGALRDIVMIATMIVALILSFVTVYVFPILAKFENTVKNTIKNAFLMSIRHLPFTIALVIIPIVPVVLMFISNALLVLIFIVFSLVALISSQLFVKIFDYYIPKEEEALKEKVDEEEKEE